METDQLGRLHDILEATRLIASYVKDTSETAFRTDIQKQDAVIRRIEIIGEATAHVSQATRRAMPELAFRKMRGMRNIVAHDLCQRGFEDRRGGCNRARTGDLRCLGEVLRPEKLNGSAPVDRASGIPTAVP